MSAQHHNMRQDFVPQHNQSQFCYPKAERAEAEKVKDRLKNRGSRYPSKNRFQPPITDKATLGDRAAHNYDSDELCPKLLPVDRQEFRGCKSRDVDRRNKRWNKDIYLGSFLEASLYDGEYIQNPHQNAGACLSETACPVIFERRMVLQ